MNCIHFWKISIHIFWKKHYIIICYVIGWHLINWYLTYLQSFHLNTTYKYSVYFVVNQNCETYFSYKRIPNKLTNTHTHTHKLEKDSCNSIFQQTNRRQSLLFHPLTIAMNDQKYWKTFASLRSFHDIHMNKQVSGHSNVTCNLVWYATFMTATAANARL